MTPPTVKKMAETPGFTKPVTEKVAAALKGDNGGALREPQGERQAETPGFTKRVAQKVAAAL